MNSIRNHASAAHSLLLVLFGAVGALWLVSCGQAPENSVVSDTGASTDADVGEIPIADVPTVGGDDVDAGVGADAGRADVDAGGADGLGTLCDDDSDCELPLTCVFPDVGAPTGVCTSACTEDVDCPAGWRCYTLTDSGSDAVRQCLPENLCIDGDGDGYGWGGGCRGRDCDDTLETINPAADELCNALDDDCDGRIDDNSIEDRTDCDTGFTGACAAGRNSCTSGTLDCVPVESTEVELCDALDNDCDGQVDEGDVCAGEPCCFGDSCLGVCGEATTAADGSCAAPESWGDDVCDGLDNDCDGAVDNAVPNEGVACAADAPGLCAAGQIACREAGLVCIAASPSTESCDAADNDCDGEIDEDGVCGVTPCCFGDDCDGVCGVSILADDGTCEAPAAYGAEVCDGLDNDCNGLVDDAIAEEGTPCATGAPGVCFAGRAVCVSGDLQCEADVLASAEICDGLDNDCDGTPDDDNACAGEPCCFAELCEGVCGTARLGEDGVCAEPPGFGADLCDARDNDCDGLVDEADPDVGTACDTGRPGICRGGVLECSALGRLSCVATATPQVEVCDLLDNDCDGVSDEGVRATYYRDVDGDGFGSAASGTMESCTALAGYVASNADCNDGDALVYPGAAEIVADGVDQSCDNQEVCFVDVDNDGYRLTSTVASADPDCGDSGEALSVEPEGDCDDANSLINPGRSELCNGVDDNCAGGIDEGGVCAGEPCCYGDTCEGVCGLARLGGDGLCAAPAGWGAEVCDGLDNDCDGVVDESDPGLGAACSTGEPGLCSAGTRACSTGRLVCVRTSAPAAETCNDVDDDCDGSTDEGVQTTYYRDADGDAYGAALSGTRRACSAPSGYVSTDSDCNDGNASIRPGATEVCNGVDDDCDGSTDEGVQSTYYRDADGDGFGSSTSGTTQACSAPSGYVSTTSDCNDGNASIRPGATEVCNGVDDDCDGSTDEGVQSTYYRDADGDGFGSSTSGTTQACSAPPGYVSTTSDCNDGNASIRPGATEVCNDVDDDCDGSTDEGVQTTYYRDADGDAYGAALSGTRQACSAPSGYVGNNSDCNDGNASINPGRTEVCNGIDDNCDTEIDNGVSCAAAQCGTASGGSTVSAPTSGLCASGIPSAVSGTGPWSWTCQGSSGFFDFAVCSSNRSCTATSQTWGSCSATPAATAHSGAASVSDNEQPTVGSATLSCSQGTWTVQSGSSCLNLDDTCPVDSGGGVTSWFSRFPQQGSDGNWYCVSDQGTTEYGTCEDDQRDIFSITGPATSCFARRRSGQCCGSVACLSECSGDLCRPTAGACYEYDCLLQEYYGNCQVP